MKKIVGAIIVAGAVLVPTAAMADTTVVISGIVAGTATGSTGSTVTSTSQDIPVLPALTPEQAKKAEHEAAEAQKKAEHDAAEAQKKADHAAAEAAKRDEHDVKRGDMTADQSGSASVWQDPTLVRNGGWKLS